MKKIILLAILSMSLFGCGAKPVEEEPKIPTKVEKEEPTQEESINTIIETLTKGTLKVEEKGFAVVTANVEDLNYEVENVKDIESNIDLSLSHVFKLYDKIQFIYKKDGITVIILDYTKESIQKGGNFLDKAQTKFIDPKYK